jgi:hypothetical protein
VLVLYKHHNHKISYYLMNGLLLCVVTPTRVLICVYISPGDMSAIPPVKELLHTSAWHFVPSTAPLRFEHSL